MAPLSLGLTLKCDPTEELTNGLSVATCKYHPSKEHGVCPLNTTLDIINEADI